MRLSFAVRRQPELAAGFGSVYWTLRTLALPALYVLALRRGRPYYVLVEQRGRIAGAFAAWGGWAGNAVVQADSASSKRAIMRLLYIEARDYFERPEQRARAVRARTVEGNRSIISGLEILGFRHEAYEYLITLPLGALTWSWRSKLPSRSRRLRSLRLVRLVRWPQGESG